MFVLFICVCVDIYPLCVGRLEKGVESLEVMCAAFETAGKHVTAHLWMSEDYFQFSISAAIGITP